MAVTKTYTLREDLIPGDSAVICLSGSHSEFAVWISFAGYPLYFPGTSTDCVGTVLVFSRCVFAHFFHGLGMVVAL